MIKKNTKVRFFVSFFLIFCIRIHAQTNVSGGIYNSTTWHKINSPYIVTDTIVVFPGVTLTIEPGVTVKFDYHTILQIRQAEIIAIGTAADSITFTSNLVNSSVADWNGIFLYGSPPANLTSKFDFCNFYFGDRVLRNQTSLSDSIRVRNSKFVHNNIGIYNSNCLIADTCQFIYNVINGIYNNYGNLYLNNCYVSHSQNAVYGGGGKIVNSIFEFNQTAFDFLKYVILNNCRISNNQYGFSNGLYGCVINSCVIDSNTIVGINATPFDSILNCEIKNNVIGH